MIIELLMKLDVILKNVGCTVTKMLDQNISRLYAGKERERNIYPSPSQSVEENEGNAQAVSFPETCAKHTWCPGQDKGVYAWLAELLRDCEHEEPHR